LLTAGTIASLILLSVCSQRIWAAPTKACTDKNAVTQKVLVLHQSSLALGKSDLYLSENAGRLVVPKLGLIIASSAPSWNIVVYSTRKNQGYTLNTASEAKTSGMSMFACNVATDYGTLHRGRDPKLQLDCTYIVMQTKNDLQKDSDTIMFQDRTQKILREAELKIGLPCKLRPELQTYINFLFDLDKYPGVPLELTTKYKDGSSVNALYTSAIEHINKSPSFFAYPSGFKKTDNKLEVLLSEDINETLEDLWGPAPKKGK